MRLRALSIAIYMLLASCAGSSPKEPEPAPPPGPALPQDYDGLMHSAERLSQSGRPDRAAELAERAAAVEPARPEAYVLWGRSLAQQNQLKEAAAKYELARKHGASERVAFIELASVYDVSGDYPAAVGVYRAWLDDNPEDTEMRQELGLTLILLERFPEAVTELRRATTSQLDNLQLQQDLGYALVRAGDAKGAGVVLQRVVDADPSNHQAVTFLARARAAEGRSQDALELLDRVISGRRASEQALRMRATLRQLTGNPEGALEDYAWLLKAKPNDPAALLGAAGALIALKRLDEAEQGVAKAAKLAPDHPLVIFRGAQIAWRRGEAPALEAMLRYARANGTSVEAWREVHAAAKKAGKRKLLGEAQKKLKALGDLR